MSDQPAVVEPADDEISLLDIALVLAENLRMLVLGPLAVGFAALGISYAIPPTFTAKTQFLPPQQQQSAATSMLASLGSIGALAGAASGIKNPSDQYVAFLKSVSLQDALIDRFGLVAKYDVENKSEARKSLEELVKISYGTKDGIIAIEVDDKDPKFAADLANAHVRELKKLMGRLAITEAQQRRAFFEKQLQEAKTNLAKAEVALKSSGVSETLLKSNPVSALAGIAALKAQVTAQEVKVGSMRNFLSEGAPEFKSALNDLSNLRSVLAKQQSTDSTDATKNQDGYIGYYRDYKYYETLYELYAKQFEIARVDEAREGAVIQVLDTAQPPERKSKPKKALIAIISTLVAAFLFILFVFVRHSVRNSASNDPRLGRLRLLTGRAFGRG